MDAALPLYQRLYTFSCTVTLTAQHIKTCYYLPSSQLSLTKRIETVGRIPFANNTRSNQWRFTCNYQPTLRPQRRLLHVYSWDCGDDVGLDGGYHGFWGAWIGEHSVWTLACKSCNGKVVRQCGFECAPEQCYDVTHLRYALCVGVRNTLVWGESCEDGFIYSNLESRATNTAHKTRTG